MSDLATREGRITVEALARALFDEYERGRTEDWDERPRKFEKAFDRDRQYFLECATALLQQGEGK